MALMITILNAYRFARDVIVEAVAARKASHLKYPGLSASE